MAGKKSNYIKLNRSMMDHWLWEAKPFSPGQAWIDLLMMASWKSGQRAWKGGFVDVERGDVLTSMKALAGRWGWTEKKVRTFIAALEKDGMVVKKGRARGTLLTIENFSSFQDRGRAEGRARGRAEGELGSTIEEGNKKVKESPAAEVSTKATSPPDWFIEKCAKTFGRV